MDYQLLVVRGRSATEAIRLGDGVTTVGRHDDCRLRIKSSQVSRRHCELFEKKGLLLVKDLGSSNGTFVNGKRIQEQRVLEPGDELTIGQVKLRVAKVGVPPPPPRTKPAAKKPGDIDIMGALSPVGDDGEFEIKLKGAAEPAIEMEVPDKEPAAPGAPQAEKSPIPEGADPEPEPVDSADDAVADFLLDLKFDEDE
ncbi:MAG: FHA domain-containing protein [Planctomycetaceae bacterium]|nr:FHA domain-containing protein [Planctomycetaceae bacterium]